MRQPRRFRSLALIAVLALVITACGDNDVVAPVDDDAPPADDDVADDDEPEIIDVVGRGDGQLVIATVLAQSGFLDYLGGPPIAGTQLAIDEINEAGGVLGQQATLLEFDSGTDPAVAVPNVTAALAEGADVIVGAMASGVSQSFIDTLNANQVYQCSPSNTSPAFSSQESAAHYFRTAPPDLPQAELISDSIIDDGLADNVVIVARADDYGVNLADLITEQLEAVGGTVAESIQYDPDDATLEAEADIVADAAPSAVVVIGFREAAVLINNLVARDLDPNTFYGSDGVFSSQLPALVGADIDGMKVFGASGTDEFNQRLVDRGVNDFLYGAQGYDCVILFALWAVAEGTDDTTQWDPQTLRDLTTGGTQCTGFAECAALLEDGEDIDYFGGSGTLILVEGNPGGPTSIGDPSFVTYAIAQFSDGGTLVSIGSREVQLR